MTDQDYAIAQRLMGGVRPTSDAGGGTPNHHRTPRGGLMRWYAVRAMPGTQRMTAATPRPIEQQHRVGESIIERNLRNEGFDVYMPAFWKDIKHQRTNKIMAKRLPLLVGYVFVNIRERDFERVRRTEGVMCFLRPSPDLPPASFKDEVIGALMLADMEAKRGYEIEKEERETLARHHRRNALRSQLGKLLQKGRRRRISMRYAADHAMNHLSPESRERVLLIIKELEGLEAVEPLARMAIAR
ncbi:transcription termination/antitermination protein NusG [Agrobacterium pusense]|uniref:transcription termination/antitermination protein NusG n=1 Tax=Agrobacterium pusense TaxID=648995 RepID=UPI0028A71378|nr:transcription termination/antitermination NusG family protein [Agrobacterium pusense]